MKNFKFFITISWLILFPASFLYPNHNILILNSYHQTLGWTDNLVENIIKNLNNENFYIEYMDTKRFPRKKIFNIFKYYLQEKYKNKRMDLIIVTDNNALEFTVSNKKTFFKNIPVIFCGINDFKYKMLKGYNDITGVAEGVDIRGTIDTILQLQPNIKKIVAIMGANYTSQLYYHRIVDLQYEYRNKTDIMILNGLFYGKDSMRKMLKEIPENSAILYLNLFKLKDGTLFGIKDSIRFIFNNTHKPIYLMWDVMLNLPGVVGGKITSARLQALSVVNFTRKILYKKIPIQQLSVITKPPTEYIFDYNEIKRFKINLNNFKDSYIVINKPSKVYMELEKNKQIVFYLESFMFIFVILTVLLIYNIRKRKISEKRLESENIQFITLLNSMQDIVVMKSPEGKWIYINKIAKDFFKLKKSDYFGKTTEELMNKLPFATSSFSEYVSDDLVWKKRKFFRYIQKFKDHNNKNIYIDVSKIPVFNNDGTKKCLIATGRDVTEYQEMQENLILAQKMDVIGKLAGGIAHDFNNILTVILNNAELCKMKLKNNDKISKFIENIIFSTERAGLLVRHLLTFAKKNIYKPVEADIELNATIRSILKILKPLIPENIQLSFLSSNLPVIIHVDDIQIEQIITNLVINARDAVMESYKKEKRIEISVNRVFLDETFLKECNKSLPPGEYGMVEIEDNGIGISSEIKEKIFEPFFTTKLDKSGTGLGLSTVAGLVEKNNGILFFITKVNIGSTFKVYFPIAKGIRNTYNNLECISFGKDEQAVNTNYKVLFVEDNVNILYTIPDSFKNRFKEFITAENGIEALNKIKGFEKDIDILITDIVMPEMDGIELSLKLKKVNPNIKIIFVSGYDSGKLKNIKTDYKFLYKPYKFKTILYIINEFQKNR